jgi:hypothetical protein
VHFNVCIIYTQKCTMSKRLGICLGELNIEFSLMSRSVLLEIQPRSGSTCPRHADCTLHVQSVPFYTESQGLRTSLALLIRSP